MNLFRKMISCLQRPVIIFLIMVVPASLQVSVAPAAAQSSPAPYPTRPITLIVPFLARGGVDTTARILAEGMKTTLGQPLVVENIPTGAGVVGVGRLAETAPDGYTIGIGEQTSNVVSAVASSVRYDVLKDFEPISLLSTSPAVLVGSNKLQSRDLKELI